MKFLKLKTLFICFYFPPFNRVGGRRWAKHLKYLSKTDCDFYVLTGGFDSTSPWDNDIKNFEDKIFRIPVKIYYPYFKKNIPKTIFQKLKWKSSFYYNKFLEKTYSGNFWDDSRGYERKFYLKAKEIIINKKITNVILSVGPYSYSQIIPKLKNDFPYITFILDYRDPWNDVRLKEKNLAEVEKEKKVIKYVDKLITVNQELVNSFSKQFNVPCLLLNHAVDLEDFQNIISKKENTELTFIYGGSLYNGLENYLKQLISLLNNIHSKGLKIKLKIYASQSGYESMINDCKFDTELRNFLPLKDYFIELTNADYILQFRPDWSPNGISSKFYELLFFKKPIIYFGPNGDIKSFLEVNNLGFHYSEESLGFIENGIICNSLANKINLNYNINQHSFIEQNKRLINFIFE
jgi:hypothetical protein